MADNMQSLIHALIYNYLLSKDKNLANVFQKKFKTASLVRKSPTLSEVVLFYLRANPNSKKIQLIPVDSDGSSCKEEYIKPKPGQKTGTKTCANKQSAKPLQKQEQKNSFGSDSSEDETPKNPIQKTLANPASKRVQNKKCSLDDLPSRREAIRKSYVKSILEILENSLQIKEEDLKDCSESSKNMPKKVIVQKKDSSDKEKAPKIQTKATAKQQSVPKTAAKKKGSSSEIFSSENVKLKSLAKITKPVAKIIKIRGRSEENSSDEEPSQKKQAVPKLPKKRAVKPIESSSEEETAKKPRLKETSARPNTDKKTEESSSENLCDEEEKVKTPPKLVVKKDSLSYDRSEEEVKTPKITTPKSASNLTPKKLFAEMEFPLKKESDDEKPKKSENKEIKRKAKNQENKSFSVKKSNYGNLVKTGQNKGFRRNNKDAKSSKDSFNKRDLFGRGSRRGGRDRGGFRRGRGGRGAGREGFRK